MPPRSLVSLTDPARTRAAASPTASAPLGPASVERSALGSEDVLAALDESVLDTLLIALEDAVARRADHLHVEPVPDAWRLRHRHDDVLVETRLDEPFALPRALDALARLLLHDDTAGFRHGAFVARLADGPRLIELRRWSGGNGDAFALTLHGPSLAPPRLDALSDDPATAAALRALLANGPRWLPIGVADEIDGAKVVRAIAQELAAPDRRLVCLEPRFHPALTGIQQIPAADVHDAAAAHEADAVLLAAAPSDVALAALAARAAEGLHVVQHGTARRPSELLARLLAFGPSPAWVALTVPALVMRYRVRLVCPFCRVGAPRDGDDEHWLATVRAPRVQDVADWLERSLRTRYRPGDGCPRCHGTAHDGVRELFEIVRLEGRPRRALLRGDIDAALEAVDVARPITASLSALVERGEVAATEAARHLRRRD